MHNLPLRATLEWRLDVNSRLVDLGVVAPNEQAPLLAEFKSASRAARTYRSKEGK